MRKINRLKEKHPYAYMIIKNLIAVIMIFILIIFIRRYLFCFNYIMSESLENTLMTDDIVFSTRLTNNIDRYDIVSFYMTEDRGSSVYIKRVIGLPGDTVEILNGDVYVNGDKIEDKYVYNDPYNGALCIGYKKFEVPEDSYFMMGDNRHNSYDSRYWKNPFVKKEDILTKALCVVYPFNHIHRIDSGED